MRIAHMCLSCFYIDDRAYQENELVKEHAKQGHDVLVIASTHVHDEQGNRAFTSPESYKLSDGADVIRLPYHSALPLSLAKSLRIHGGVYQLLEDFSPDIIMFHGMCGWELITAASYKKRNPPTKLYVDNHSDFINSANGFLSKWVLHYFYYRLIVKFCLPSIDKLLCVSRMTWEFAENFYGVPVSKLEFYPLGGHPVSPSEYNNRRNDTRTKLGIEKEEVVFIQSGKQSSSKRLISTLRAFSAVSDERFRLLIVGAILDEIRDEAVPFIEGDSRITFLGWKEPSQLEDLLCAADVYVQPGSQSSTMQTSVCCYCATILQDIRGHEVYTDGNGWLVNTDEDLRRVFEEISEGKVDLSEMKDKSKKLAESILDYSILARRVLQ